MRPLIVTSLLLAATLATAAPVINIHTGLEYARRPPLPNVLNPTDADYHAAGYLDIQPYACPSGMVQVAGLLMLAGIAAADPLMMLLARRHAAATSGGVLNFLIAEDQSAYELHGTCSTNVILTADPSLTGGYYADFGTDDRYIQIANTNLYGGAEDPHTGTIIFRARRLANSATHYVFSRGGYAGGSKSSYGVYVNGSQAVVLMVESSAIFANTAVNRFLDSDGWTEWAITWDGNGSKAKCGGLA